MGLSEALSIRHRASWNDRLSHWERPESDSEAVRIERARRMVQEALAENRWLNEEGVKLVPQGSFTNRTNIRLESDIDLRVQHPIIRLNYSDSVHQASAYQAGGYSPHGRSFAQILSEMRRHIVDELVAVFGKQAVDASGKKAIRVCGLDGSRAEVDVVPSFTLHNITGTSPIAGNSWHDGIAILGTDEGWTFNYPDQHIANGRAKRLRTALQFKRLVRMTKRLQADMIDKGVAHDRVPSFLIECLIYAVEDHYFIVVSDDRYNRIRRVLKRVDELLTDPLSRILMTEINGIKPLFGAGQAWTEGGARAIVRRALEHLGDAA